MTKKVMERLRKKKWKDIVKEYNQINTELSRFRAVTSFGGEGPISLPSGRTGRGTDWGRVKKLKRQKARILTLMNQRGYPTGREST